MLLLLLAFALVAADVPSAEEMRAYTQERRTATDRAAEESLRAKLLWAAQRGWCSTRFVTPLSERLQRVLAEGGYTVCVEPTTANTQFIGESRAAVAWCNTAELVAEATARDWTCCDHTCTE